MRVEPAAAVAGHVAVPGDKSVSHRALLIGAVCEGETRIEGLGLSGDVEATLGAVTSLGAEVAQVDVDVDVGVHVCKGVGVRGLREPPGPIDCGNAGTLIRLLSGLLSGQEGRFELTGDESLRARPMERVAGPLRRMGAEIVTKEGRAPVVVEGRPLQALDYELPVASAQVKSAILLAALNAEGRTTVVEPQPTRDHTELMLEAAGARVARRPRSVSLERAERLSLGTVEVPGDFSSAAPLIVAALLLAGSELTIHGVGLNPRRTALLDVLERMGGRIAVFNRRRAGGEPVGDVEVRHAQLVATAVTAEEVPRMIDELPLFALAAAMARGESAVTGAAELRHKETDRIETVTNALQGVGVRIRDRDDGFTIKGVPTRPRGGAIDAAGDHRIAMLGAIAGLVSRDGVEIGGAEAVAISFPGFFELLDSVTTR